MGLSNFNSEFQRPMISAIEEKFRKALSQSDWAEAAALLQNSDLANVVESLRRLPFEQQQKVFLELPLQFAASLIPRFPYYDQYVLLHSRSRGEMRALVDQMNPDDRMRFFDELPEEAWQRLMDELADAEEAASSGLGAS